jgi:1,4-dihydroxy-2-naphthoate octaprenyltransferase
MSPRSVTIVTAAAFTVTLSAAALLSCLAHPISSLPYVAIAIFISIAYSAPPLHLKARAMGDVPIFIGFGPLPSAFVWHVTTGTPPPLLLLSLAVPFGLWAVAVLHRNNIRDAAADARVGTTLAVLLGERRSRDLFRGLLTLAVLSGSFTILCTSSSSSAAAASASALLLLIGRWSSSGVLALEPCVQPQHVVQAAVLWGVSYLALMYAVGVACT